MQPVSLVNAYRLDCLVEQSYDSLPSNAYRSGIPSRISQALGRLLRFFPIEVKQKVPCPLLQFILPQWSLLDSRTAFVNRKRHYAPPKLFQIR